MKILHYHFTPLFQFAKQLYFGNPYDWSFPYFSYIADKNNLYVGLLFVSLL